MTRHMREFVTALSESLADGNENDGLLVMDGYDDCIVGVATRFCDGGHESFVVYDRRRVLQRLMAEGMDEAEAEEFHEYNQVGAFHGPRTPAFLDTPEPVSDVEDDTMQGEV